MPTHDRLTLGAPVLLFGGPYSNLEATRAVLTEARRRSIPPERIVCTGDVVAYCADANATVDLRKFWHPRLWATAKKRSRKAVRLLLRVHPRKPCDILSAGWFAHAEREIGADERAWMAGLPRRLDIEIRRNNIPLTVVHGSDHPFRVRLHAGRREIGRSGEFRSGRDRGRPLRPAFHSGHRWQALA